MVNWRTSERLVRELLRDVRRGRGAFRLMPGQCERVLADLVKARRLLKQHDAALRVAADQAKDEALWFLAKHATEAYLQRALRELHAALGDT